MLGNVSRDPEGAMKRAEKEKKPLCIVAINPKNKEMKGPETSNQFCLRCFFEQPETKRLISEKCVQVLTTTTHKSLVMYVDAKNPVVEPVILFVSFDGKLLARLASNVNPKDALKRVKEVLPP
jgi:hypothetical protein